jgi:sulfonate transport system substrate-binding protein
MHIKKTLSVVAVATVTLLALSGCVAGENATADPKPSASSTAKGETNWSATTLNIDYATYNPLSLIIKDQGWLEKTFGDKVKVNWIQSAGSAPANLALRSGSLDVGSTAGSAALLARSNGSPIKTIDVFDQPDWAALLVPKGSSIKSVADLKGKTVAAFKGTDPYFFLVQALNHAHVPLSDVTIDNLAHADGKAALENGTVPAWSGLDPLLSTSVATAGSKVIYDNINYNSYGFLNATESFLSKSPDIAQVVVDAYEKARAWAIANPTKTASILASVAGIDPTIATAVLSKRTNFKISGVPGEREKKVLKVIGPIFVQTGDVPSQSDIDTGLSTLFQPKYAEKAQPSNVG